MVDVVEFLNKLQRLYAMHGYGLYVCAACMHILYIYIYKFKGCPNQPCHGPEHAPDQQTPETIRILYMVLPSATPEPPHAEAKTGHEPVDDSWPQA